MECYIISTTHLFYNCRVRKFFTLWQSLITEVLTDNRSNDVSLLSV